MQDGKFPFCVNRNRATQLDEAMWRYRSAMCSLIAVDDVSVVLLWCSWWSERDSSLKRWKSWKAHLVERNGSSLTHRTSTNANSTVAAGSLNQIHLFFVGESRLIDDFKSNWEKTQCVVKYSSSWLPLFHRAEPSLMRIGFDEKTNFRAGLSSSGFVSSHQQPKAPRVNWI